MSVDGDARSRALDVWEPQPRATLHELVAATASHREVIVAFAARTIRVRYKEAWLGFAWAVLQPVAIVAPLLIILGHVAKLGGGGVPYTAFALATIAPWQFVATSINNASSALVNEGPLLRKVYLPKAVPVLGAVLASAFDLAISAIVITPACFFVGAHLRWTLLLYPLAIVLLVPPVVGLALPLAVGLAHFRDVRFVTPLLAQILLYASPVVYPLTTVPSRWRPWAAAANPLAGPFDFVRHVVALGTAPDWSLVGISAGAGVLWLAVGLVAFRALEADVADLV